MVRNEGWGSLYKGVTAPLLGNMLLLGIHFPVFSRTRKALEEKVGARGWQGARARGPPPRCWRT